MYVYVTGLNIARLTLRVLKTPADLSVSLSEKIKGYSKITADLIRQYKNAPAGARRMRQAYTAARLALTAAVASIASGSAMSVSGAANTARRSAAVSREEAVLAADQITALLEEVTAFCDTKTAQNVFVDGDSEAYLALVELTQSSVNFILNAAFALPMRRSIKLGQDRQVIELCSELYGSVEDEIVNQFIMDNNLNINEIIIIPAGREVSYYVQSA